MRDKGFITKTVKWEASKFDSLYIIFTYNILSAVVALHFHLS